MPRAEAFAVLAAISRSVPAKEIHVATDSKNTIHIVRRVIDELRKYPGLVPKVKNLALVLEIVDAIKRKEAAGGIVDTRSAEHAERASFPMSMHAVKRT